jgi:hypothetical protein
MSPDGTVSPMSRDALRAALDEQAQSIRTSRNAVSDRAGEQIVGSGGSGQGAGSGGGSGGAEMIRQSTAGSGTIALDWAKLPPRVARDLRASMRENNSGEFRKEINAYFQALAEKAAR